MSRAGLEPHRGDVVCGGEGAGEVWSVGDVHLAESCARKTSRVWVASSTSSMNTLTGKLLDENQGKKRDRVSATETCR